MKRKVLIPLDGSDFSLQIVRIVLDFFNPHDVSLILLRVAPPPNLPLEIASSRDMIGSYPLSGSYETYSSAVERGYTEAEQELQAQREELLVDLRPEADHLREMGYAVKLEVQFGDPAQRIVQYVNDEEVSLVAMATHGRSGLTRLVMGSVAERVLRSVSAPVLLLRPESMTVVKSAGEKLATALSKGDRLRMAVATDGSTFGQRAVTLASELHTAFGGALTVLVTASGREDAAQAQQIMKDTVALLPVDPKPETVPLVGYADERLLQYLQNNPVDLLVVGAFADRGAGGVNAVGPTAHRLVQEAPTTVLLMKGHRHTFRRVLVCTSVEDEAVVAVGAQFAQMLGARLDLLHVMPPSAAPYLASDASATMDVDRAIAQGTRLSTKLHEWERKLEAHGFTRAAIILQPGSVPEVILQRARDGDYDLVVVGSESSPGHFPGSIANTVVRYVEQSVLLVRVHST